MIINIEEEYKIIKRVFFANTRACGFRGKDLPPRWYIRMKLEEQVQACLIELKADDYYNSIARCDEIQKY